MRVSVFLLVPWMALACLGCRSGRNLQNVPAVIANPSQQTEAELRRVVSAALYGAQFEIPENPLTQSSVLVVEIGPRAGSAGAADGGDADRQPVLFRLLINGPNCILVNQTDLRRWRLGHTLCIPE